jgi:S-(hydroxymethyl)glutathione dehydrogenase/alcohol dehydrogenase
MKTRAVVVYEQNRPVVVEELRLEDPKPHEVLLRMAAAGVCHSDLSVITGAIPYEPPVALGHEGAAIVESVGDDVSYVRPGDHVILSFVTYCGQCVMCQMNHAILCRGFKTRRGYLLDDTCRLHNAAGREIPQMSRIGTMSELSVVPEQSLVKIDPRYPLDRAALVGCGVTTGVGAVLNTAKVEAGSTVVIVGAGGVGLNVVQGARLADAGRIIVVDIFDHKLQMARQFGATDTVNAAQTDPVQAVLDMTNGLGVDYGFEVIGNPTAIAQMYAMVRPAGTAVLVGIPRVDAQLPIPAQSLIFNEKRLLGCFYGSCIPRVDMPRMMHLYDEGKLKLDELITRTYRLDEINQAFADMEAGVNARGMIVFDH